jgi:hypothetical protein
VIGAAAGRISPRSQAGSSNAKPPVGTLGTVAACWRDVLTGCREVVTRGCLVFTGFRDTVAGRETCWGTTTTGWLAAGTVVVVGTNGTMEAARVVATEVGTEVGSALSSRVASTMASRLATPWNVTLLFWIDCACSVADCPGMATTSMAPPKARALLNNI